MRTRNIKINVYLSEDEKNILLKKSNKAKLSQSDFFRILIQNYSKKKVLNKDLDKSIISLTIVSDNLSKIKYHGEKQC